MKPKGKAPPLAMFADIRARLSPLILFYVEHKPLVTEIFVYSDDYKALQSWPKLAARYGFVIEGDAIKFQGYTLRPIGD